MASNGNAVCGLDMLGRRFSLSVCLPDYGMNGICRCVAWAVLSCWTSIGHILGCTTGWSLSRYVWVISCDVLLYMSPGRRSFQVRGNRDCDGSIFTGCVLFASMSLTMSDCEISQVVLP